MQHCGNAAALLHHLLNENLLRAPRSCARAQLNLAIIGVLHAAMALEDPFDNLGLDGIYIDEAVFDIEQVRMRQLLDPCDSALYQVFIALHVGCIATLPSSSHRPAGKHCPAACTAASHFNRGIKLLQLMNQAYACRPVQALVSCPVFRRLQEQCRHMQYASKCQPALTALTREHSGQFALRQAWLVQGHVAFAHAAVALPRPVHAQA